MKELPGKELTDEEARLSRFSDWLTLWETLAPWVPHAMPRGKTCDSRIQLGKNLYIFLKGMMRQMVVSAKKSGMREMVRDKSGLH